MSASYLEDRAGYLKNQKHQLESIPAMRYKQLRPPSPRRHRPMEKIPQPLQSTNPLNPDILIDLTIKLPNSFPCPKHRVHFITKT